MNNSFYFKILTNRDN